MLRTDGALTFGGTNGSLYEGDITYTPVTTTYPSSYYWGINVTGATYGETTVIPGSYAGIVDTGTTCESPAHPVVTVARAGTVTLTRSSYQALRFE